MFDYTHIIQDLCSRCGECYVICPLNAIRIVQASVYDSFYSNTYSVNRDYCVDCGECVKGCPDYAIVGPVPPQEDYWDERDFYGSIPGGSTPSGPSQVPRPFKFKTPCTPNQEFENNLNNVLDSLNQNCFGKVLFQLLTEKQGNDPLKEINICFNPSLDDGNGYTPAGTYNPNVRTMAYPDEWVTEFTFIHETFHAFQHLSGLYPNFTSMGKNSDTRVNSPGFANIEFEAMLFNNIIDGTGSRYITQLSSSNLLTTTEISDLTIEYNTFIDSFWEIDGRLKIPDNINLFNTNYNKFLDLYANYSDVYRSDVLDHYRSPIALLEVLNKILVGCNAYRATP